LDQAFAAIRICPKSIGPIRPGAQPANGSRQTQAGLPRSYELLIEWGYQIDSPFHLHLSDRRWLTPHSPAQASHSRVAPPSSNGRTLHFECGDRGSNPRGGSSIARCPRGLTAVRSPSGLVARLLDVHNPRLVLRP